jgi:hypothetical protein
VALAVDRAVTHSVRPEVTATAEFVLLDSSNLQCEVAVLSPVGPQNKAKKS